ncbi:MAG TPA: hypothetical protein VFZ09_38545 [Archangium sp.]|uniref:hypothetical protein n=1 Tax=Archangium sp. TaxID=1872627 RepID=UPI002E33C83C|nr:hypothetical protein [Archangium sp.]HEX5752177.1 hypothetical protein [Archangium sp.]
MSTRPSGPPGQEQRQPSPGPGLPGLFVLVLLAGGFPLGALGQGLGSIGTARRATPSQYAQTMDSATNGCLRNPACYKPPPGEEAIIPWLNHTASAARTASTVSMMLEDADVKIIEGLLTRCARQADEKVNKEDDELQGQEPTREQCKKVVRREANREVTRAMELGTRKHELALDCIRAAVTERLAKHISVEPTYQKDPHTGQWRWIDPKQVEEWLQLGLKSKLWGALVPDVVVHAPGNPNQAQRLYDLKFPCPPENDPSWGRYAPGQPHHPKTQEQMYRDALRLEKKDVSFSTPKGIK